MNERNDDIAQLFARQEELSPSEVFAEEVRHAIKRARLHARLLVMGGAAGLVALITLAAVAFPFGALPVIQLAQEFLMSRTGMLACAGCALMLTVWLQFVDA
jgi:hypothetical protein